MFSTARPFLNITSMRLKTLIINRQATARNKNKTDIRLLIILPRISMPAGVVSPTCLPSRQS